MILESYGICMRTPQHYATPSTFTMEAYSGAGIRFPTNQFSVVGPEVDCEQKIVNFINNDGIFDRSIDIDLKFIVILAKIDKN